MTTRFTFSRRATPAEAAAIRAKRAKGNAPPALSEDTKALIVNTITEQVDALPKAADGSPGDDGADGWSPLFALTEDGERRVMELIDWTGVPARSRRFVVTSASSESSLMSPTPWMSGALAREACAVYREKMAPRSLRIFVVLGSPGPSLLEAGGPFRHVTRMPRTRCSGLAIMRCLCGSTIQDSSDRSTAQRDRVTPVTATDGCKRHLACGRGTVPRHQLEK